jgi:hypothetical protein
MLRMALDETLMHWKNVLLMGLWIAIAMIMCVILVTTFKHQSVKYDTYGEFMADDGIRMYMGQTASCNANQDLQGFMDEFYAKDYIYSKTAYAYFNGLTDEEFTISAYNNIIADYSPTMSEGVWITDWKDDEYPGIVLTNLCTEYKVGDLIDIFYDEDGNYFTACVCGKILSDEEIPATKTYASNPSIFDYYEAIALSDDAEHCTFMSLDTIEQYQIGNIDSAVYINFKDNLTNDEKEDIDSKLITYQCMYNSFEDIKSASLEIIWERVGEIIPIALLVTFFITVNIIVNAAIECMNSSHRYAVFYTVGMKWKHILIIVLAKGIIAGIIGFAFTVLFGSLVKLTTLRQVVLFELGDLQLFLCLIEVVYFIIISIIIPVFTIIRKNPVEVLRKNRL